MNFTGARILISGGSSGIGLSLSKMLAQRGANIAILARRLEPLQEAYHRIKNMVISEAQSVEIIQTDVSDFEKLQASYPFSEKHFDILINSAGIAYPGEFLDLEPGVFRSVMEINYLGTVNLTKLVAPGMVANKSGYIVNISSLAALIGIYGYTAYASSKFAVRGFTHCLRAELKPLGIDVSIVYPPDTDTPQLAFERSRIPAITKKINQSGGVLSPDKVAEAIIHGIAKKNFAILPGFEGKLLYRFSSLIDRYMYHYAVRLANKSK